jgi:serine/threonine protein kinase
VHAEFEFPDHISGPARDLIRKMLTVDPEKRATMQDVRAHPFMNDGYSVSGCRSVWCSLAFAIKGRHEQLFQCVADSICGLASS